MTNAEILARIAILKADPLAGEDQFLDLYELLDMSEAERTEHVSSATESPFAALNADPLSGEDQYIRLYDRLTEAE